ncbi:galactoside alpha-(1,2)-fucosyltransferase 2-like [Penaeus monodon]|uniref:galactoside alpha-(1,2)-fucosyltransferase 2-like n=1 Tax=Penaeus monodon TaxID=6687 RepID=UPI0018A748BA|nr:galactoside alpha-(1,2)-fucosyltransferase 2-like [Penaeus monodon]
MCRDLLQIKTFVCALILASGGYLFLNDMLRLRVAVYPVADGLTAPALRPSEDEKSDLAPVTPVPHTNAAPVTPVPHTNAAPVILIPPSRRVRYANLSWHGYSLPVLTCQPKGRLGNLMGEYATLWGLRRTYNVTVLVSPKMKKGLRMFSALSLPTLEAPRRAPGPSPHERPQTEWRRVGRSGGSLYNFSLVEAASAGLLGPHHFQIQNSPFEMQLFGRFKDDLRREFAFPKGIRDQAQRFLSQVKQSWHDRSASGAEPTFVGFHVRRTDYGPHVKKLFRGDLPGVRFFERAMAYYREKFAGGVAFIAASDNPRFINATLSHNPDVYFAPGRLPGLDLAVLASCNHSIITLGSFGFWAGFLAGGEVIYPDTRFRRPYRYMETFSLFLIDPVNIVTFPFLWVHTADVPCALLYLITTTCMH